MIKKVCFICLLWTLVGVPAYAQAPAPRAQRATDKPAVDRASAYYHYAMGHLYAELAGAYGNRGEHLNQAIDHLRQAIKADPGARLISEELADLYIQSNRLREGVLDAEAALRENANDLNARRILGRIYMRLIGDTQQGRINEEMLRRATEQYSKIVENLPSDLEAWLVLGRLHKVGQNSVESEKAFQKALEIDPENGDAMAGLAIVYADLGDNARAAEYFRKVAERNPNLRTLTQLARTYEEMRDHALAAETLKRALELDPDNSDLKRALAQNLVFADRFDEALELYRALIGEDPKDLQSHLRISQIYRQQRKFDLARKASDEAKKLDPDNLEVLYNEVGIFEAEGKMAEAISTLKNVISSTAKRNYTAAERNNRALLLERLGFLYRNNEVFPEALGTFRELGSLDASLAPRAAAQVIETYRQAREFTKALEEADAAARKWPEDRTLRMVRSSVLADVGKTEQAAAEVRKLLDGKNDRETHLALAQTYEKGKNFAEMAKAIDAAEKLSVTEDDKEVVHFMRGAMYEKMKKPEESEAEFRKVLAINPDSASALNYLGYMLADRNVRLNEALELIQKALEQDPFNGAYLDSLGWVYFRLGRLEEAEDYLRRAVQRVSRDPVIRDHLGDVYAKQGNFKDAIVQWELSVKLWNSSSPSEQDPEEIAKIQRKLESARVRLAKEPAK